VQRCKPMLTLNKAGPAAGYLLYPFDSFSLVVIVAIPWWVHNCNDRSPALGGKRCMVRFFGFCVLLGKLVTFLVLLPCSVWFLSIHNRQ